MAEQVILAFDQSTAGTKAVLFTKDAAIAGKALIPHTQHYPQRGWVEHDPMEILKNTEIAALQALESAGMDFSNVKAIAITNQRETVLIWDKETGKPVCNAIVWQDGRAETVIEARGEHVPYLRNITGLEPSPFFSAPKLCWMLENVPEAKKLAAEGRLCFGTMDSFLLFSLTGGRAHKCDVTNASRTLLLDLENLKWDKKAFEIFGVPESAAPEIVLCDNINESTVQLGTIPADIPICSMIGDSHGALFGQCAFAPGSAKVTLGTGSSVMMNTGSRFVRSKSGLVSSVAYGVGGTVNYCLEGNINTTGGIMQWLIDNLGILENASQSGTVSESLEDNGGVYLVPALAGLAAPHWRSDVQAAFVGMTLATTKEHLVRAGEEAIAYQIADVVHAMEADTGEKLAALLADGGPTRDKFLMGFLASLLSCTVDTPIIAELSAMGAAFIAGMVTGFFPDIEGLHKLRKSEGQYTPVIGSERIEAYYEGYKNALKLILK